MIILFVILILTIGFISFLLINLVIPFTKGAPFVRSYPDKLITMMKLARIRKGEKSVDIGSGDGALVILSARNGADAYGYEINPFLVMKSRKNIRKAGVKNAEIIWGSFWTQDLSRFDVITVYGIGFIMKDLEKKIKHEAKKGTRIVSNFYRFPNLNPKKQENDTYLYII